MSKCIFCDKEYRQDKDHWIWLYMSEKDKKRYGYYKKEE